MSTKRVLLSVLLSSIAATAPTQGGLQWGPCPTQGVRGDLYKNNVSAIECTSILVPLDYTAPGSGAVHNISLVRAPAPKQPAKGAIQFNFGGPGGPAISTLVETANIYQGLTGEEYDLIAFDPRGVSMELPFVCATTDQSALQVLQSIFDVSVSERDARRAWALAQQIIGLCQYLGNGNATASYIGTAFMARDMERVAQEVDKDGLIRFWGFSYGTTLGVTIASMFPEKIGGMILDGIQNAKEYYHGLTDAELWTLSDKAIEYFFYSCAQAGPEICPLAASNRSGKEMTRDFYDLVEVVTHDPIGVPEAGAVFDGSFIKSTMFSASYDVGRWKDTSAMLLPLLYGTPEERDVALTLFLTGGLPLKDIPPNGVGMTEFNLGIHCGDRVPRTEVCEDLVSALRNLYATSYIVGGLNAIIQMICAQWPWKAKEIHQGNFEAKTKTPVLFMSNSLDGQTPLVSARNMSAGFEGAVILENDGVGHTAHSYPTTCKAKHVIAYWNEGKMPEEGTICPSESGPFEKRAWLETLQALASKDPTENFTISARQWLLNYYT